MVGRPRQRNEEEPADNLTSSASRRRTGTTARPLAPISSASRRPQGSSTLTTADRDRPASKRRRLALKYSSMDPWWSRWSRLRLVNAATSKTMPSTRCWVSACEDTSTATAWRPSAAEGGQTALEERGLGRGPLTVQGADGGGGPPGVVQDGLDQVGDRGLAVGSGDADHGQPPCRVPEERGRHLGHGRPDLAHRHPDLGDGQVHEVLAQERGGSPAHRLGGVGMAVGVGTRGRSRTASPAPPSGCRTRSRSPRSTWGRRAHRRRRCRGSARSSARVSRSGGTDGSPPTVLPSSLRTAP